MTDASKAESEIHDLLQRWASAVRSHDLNAVLAHHADDILMFDVVGPSLLLEGIDAYKQSWPQVFRWLGDTGKFEFRDLKVSAGSDLAFATALLDCAGTELGKPVQYTLRLTICLKKAADQWIVVHEHHSEPLPIPAEIG
jgi:ketosteroid isomerase-like protein